MYNLNYDFHLTGWECPRCHRIYAPSVSSCLYCNDKRVVWAEKTSVDDSGWWQDYIKRTSADSNINIGEDGSISWRGPVPETYLENMSWRDWLDYKTNPWEE